MHEDVQAGRTAYDGAADVVAPGRKRVDGGNRELEPLARRKIAERAIVLTRSDREYPCAVLGREPHGDPRLRDVLDRFDLHVDREAGAVFEGFHALAGVVAHPEITQTHPLAGLRLVGNVGVGRGEVLGQIGSPHLMGRADQLDVSAREHHRAVAELLHETHGVGHQDDRLTLLLETVEDVQALLLERRVAHRQHLIDQHHIGIGVHHHREREAHLHARRVVLQLLVDEALQSAEGDDLVEAVANHARVEPHHHRVDLDVVARRQVRIESDAELDERRQLAGDMDRASVGAVDARKALQQRALPRAVAPDDPEELPLLDLKRDALEDVELVVALAAQRVQHPLLERVGALLGDAKRLLESVDSDGQRGRRHGQEHRRGSLRSPRALAHFSKTRTALESSAEQSVSSLR